MKPCRGFKSFRSLAVVIRFLKKCIFGSSNPSTRRKIENGSMEIRKKLGAKKAEKSLEISAFLVFSRSDLNRPKDLAGAEGFEPTTLGFGESEACFPKSKMHNKNSHMDRQSRRPCDDARGQKHVSKDCLSLKLVQGFPKKQDLGGNVPVVEGKLGREKGEQRNSNVKKMSQIPQTPVLPWQKLKKKNT